VSALIAIAKSFFRAGSLIIPPSPLEKIGKTPRNCRESPPFNKGDLRTSTGKEFMVNALNPALRVKI
jgi:hypothetical protein